MHKYPSMVFHVDLNTMIQGLDMFLIEEPFHLLHQSSTPLSGNDFNKLNSLLNCLINDSLKLGINFAAFIENIVKI